MKRKTKLERVHRDYFYPTGEMKEWLRKNYGKAQQKSKYIKSLIDNDRNKQDKPNHWRTGQTIFNFLEWLAKNKGYDTEESIRMADPFHMSNSEWDKYYKEFINLVK